MDAGFYCWDAVQTYEKGQASFILVVPQNHPPFGGTANGPIDLRALATNYVHFRLAMLAYKLDCWLLLFQREEAATVALTISVRMFFARGPATLPSASQ